MKKAATINIFLIISLIMLLSCKSPVKPEITSEKFGKLPDGSVVKLYSLSNSNGLTARITNYGAKLVSLFAPDKKGNLIDVILGYDSLQGYLKGDPYMGSTIGRYANRIANGKFTLNGKEYQLAINNGVNHLHGGPGGFQSVLWKSEIIRKNGYPALKLSYLSPDGEEGYPGNLEIQVIYILNEKNELVIEYDATCDQDTYVNFTHHSYFNLKGAGEGDILDHELMLAADYFTPADAMLIPLGELRSVKDTPMDFNVPTKVGNRINEAYDQLSIGNGYDHNWVLKSNKIGDLAASLYEPISGLLMEVYTTEPGIQLYSGNFFDGSTKGHGGKPYYKWSGLALETQHYPDSPNHPNFPSTLLKKGEKYNQITIYKFLIK